MQVHNQIITEDHVLSNWDLVSVFLRRHAALCQLNTPLKLGMHLSTMSTPVWVYMTHVKQKHTHLSVCARAAQNVIKTQNRTPTTVRSLGTHN